MEGRQGSMAHLRWCWSSLCSRSGWRQGMPATQGGTRQGLELAGHVIHHPSSGTAKLVSASKTRHCTAWHSTSTARPQPETRALAMGQRARASTPAPPGAGMLVFLAMSSLSQGAG